MGKKNLSVLKIELFMSLNLFTDSSKSYTYPKSHVTKIVKVAGLNI